MSIFDCLGSVFGSSAPSAMGNMHLADFQYAMAADHAAWVRRHPHTVLPVGIFWERTGGRTHRVTIRRHPEVVVDLSGLGG